MSDFAARTRRQLDESEARDTDALAAFVETLPKNLAKRAEVKVSMSDAEYVDQSPCDDHCALCVMFRKNEDDKFLGSCTKVDGDGDISPRGWCKFYYAKTEN
jgi:hypothetical protein